MKLCRYGLEGEERPGLIDELGDIRDLGTIVDDIDGDWLAGDGVTQLGAIDVTSLQRIGPSTRLAPPIGKIGKIVCAGMNYIDHCEEAGFPVPEQPALFMKATSALCGANDNIVIPTGARQVDWEVELAAVIGRRGKNISGKDALNYVAGYTILNDVSDRDFQFNRGGQWFKGKSADTFCPIGPWLVTADEISDPQKLNMYLDVNENRMQLGNTSKMVFSVAELIVHISEFMTLMPGDIVSTGTPPGVGMGQKPEPRYLNRGDILSLGIDGLGHMRQQVI